MWKKALVIIFLFYFFALLQNSFLIHYNFFGSYLNLVFILFFLLIFFSAQGANAQARPASGWEVIFFAIIAGFISDIFSYNHFGISVVLLLCLGFLLKKAQSSLNLKEDKFPFAYFAPLFFVFLGLYNATLMGSAHFFNLPFFVNLLLNLLAASLGFLIFKKFFKYAGKV